MSGKPLTTFAKPGETFKSDKPAKPFGAPESDAEEGSDKDDDGDDGSNHSEAGDKEGKDDSDEEEAKGTEEKKKKLQRGTCSTPCDALYVARVKLTGYYSYCRRRRGWRGNYSGRPGQDLLLG